MDRVQYEKMEATIRFRQSQSLKRALRQVLLSIAIFLFLYITYLSMSATLLHVLTSTNREVMFLFCNAILIILAKDSSLFVGTVALQNDVHDEFVVRKVADNHHHATGKVVSPECSSKAIVAVDERAEESGLEEKVGEDSVEKVHHGCWDVAVVDEEEGDEIPSAEELHKRFDEFIEKVKRQRRLEAQQLDFV